MTGDVLTEARRILREVREAATLDVWELREVRAPDSEYFQIVTRPHLESQRPAVVAPRIDGPGDAALIFLLAGNPALLDALDGMLADALGLVMLDAPVTRSYQIYMLHALYIASAIVTQWKAMQG